MDTSFALELGRSWSALPLHSHGGNMNGHPTSCTKYITKMICVTF